MSKNYYVRCDDDCLYEGMTKEQILTAIEQAVETGAVTDPDGAVISKIKEIRANSAVQIWKGTQAQFNALSPAPTVGNTFVRVGTDGVLYICTDDEQMDALLGHITNKSNPHEVTFAQVIGNSSVPIANGGTGATTAKGARTNLGAECGVYSTSEVDTGNAWIDGKPIYRAVISKSVTAATSYTVIGQLPSAVVTPVSIRAYAQHTDGGWRVIPNAYHGDNNWTATIMVKDKEVAAMFGSAWSGSVPMVVIVDYTKS